MIMSWSVVKGFDVCFILSGYFINEMYVLMMRKISGLLEDVLMMGVSQEQKFMFVCVVFFFDWCYCFFYLFLL